ncbi:unnamed protein product, partial [Brenthis ino]
MLCGVQAFVIFVLKYNLIAALSLNTLPEDPKLNFTGLATKHGLPPIEYKVITEDHYILTLYRLPGTSRYPVLLMHGISDSSDTFLLREETSLGITLARDGYDVWFGNSRGNRYSREHVYLNPDKNDTYWDFSFHEMGYYDLPAIIDIILNETGAPSVTAIGHSQGNTIFYVLGSTRREYNSKINVMIALAPISYLHHSIIVSPLIPISPVIEAIVNELKINEFLGDNSVITRILRRVCPVPVIGYAVCILGIMFPISGYDPAELGESFVPIFGEHFPTGTSAKDFLHFLQVGKNKKFARYDYGTQMNQAVYNSTNPPIYDLEKVTMPIALLAGKNDFLSSLEDVAILRKQLPNVVYYLVNPRSQMNHLDYIWVVAALITCSLLRWESESSSLGVSVGIMGGALLVILLVLYRQPRGSVANLSFKVPLVPLVPFLSVCLNVYLMVQLHYQTWVRFIIWLGYW